VVPLLAAGALVLSACGTTEDATDAGQTEGLDTDVEIGDGDTTEDGIEGDDTATEDTGDELGAQAEGAAFDTVTFGLRLDSVTVDEFSLDDDEPEFVEYCFTDTVQEVSEGAGFRLVSFDPSDRLDASSVELLEDDQSCVLAEFESGTDLDSYALATVQNGAVTTVEGEGNVQSSQHLAGTNAVGQATTLPELISASADEQQDQVQFRFDEDLGDEAEPDTSALGFYTESADIISGTEVIDVEDNVVTVGFDSDGLIEEAVRFFANGGAVSDSQGDTNVPTSVGGATAAPDLQSASPSGDTATQFNFTFDENVTVGDAEASAFSVVTAAGERFQGESVDSVDAQTVQVTFPNEIEDFADQLVLAAADYEAVTANEQDGIGNTAAAAVVGDASTVGATAGPDLIDASLDADTGDVVLTFDENLDEENADATSILLITESGEVVQAEQLVEVSDEQAVVSFGEANAEAAQGITVSTGAVQDDAGTPNPVATLAI
jgi:hypothetical protein